MNSDDSIKEEEMGKDIEGKSMRFQDHFIYSVDDEAEVVDILECSSNDKIEIEVSECSNDEDTDVCSNSSFCGTVSEHDDETDDQTASKDQEADSMMMCTDSDASLPFLVRKKKLTDHWRRFIHPITWRCKWLELRIRELQGQAGKYDKELQESSQAKQLELENLKSEELGGVKALSLLPCHAMQTRHKKRRKRKRVEEAPSYALNHNLFSYHEYRKSFGDVALNDNSRNLDKKNKNSKEEAVFYEEEETSPLEFREGDAFLEQILLKIEAVKLQARNLKNRVDKVVNENPSSYSSVNTLNMLGSGQQNEAKPVKPTSHHNDTQPEDEDGTTDILLSEMMASVQREGKGIVPNKKLQKTEQASSIGEGSSRPVRIRKPRNRDVEVKEETKRKRRKVSKEKPKCPNRQRNRMLNKSDLGLIIKVC